MKTRSFFIALLLLTVPAFACSVTRGSGESGPAQGTAGVVVSSHSAASGIGAKVLQRGGNAVDAAVAVGLALGVVDQFNSGIGGGGFLLIRMADGRVFAIDGREKAPGAATRDLYIRKGEYVPSLSREGVLAVAVPGLLAAYAKALEIAGTRSLGELIEPSIELAREGFVLDSHYISRYREAMEALGRDPASAKGYFRRNGSQLQPNEIFRQPGLAETYGKIAESGLDYFYRGEFAERLATYMKRQGGLITLEDMRQYRAVLREPVQGSYRGYTVYGMPPPSSGGVHVQQILNMLDVSGILKGKTSWGRKTIFWTSRFMSRAFEDRAVYLGDTDFCPVPVKRLIARSYAEQCVRELMNSSRDEEHNRSEVPGCGYASLSAGFADSRLPFRESGHTTNLVVVDSRRNAVSINQTVNLNFGAKITLPGTGVILNNEMDDFSARPGAPNAFGLVGSEANAIEPGKRPLSSMSPTIVVKGDQPILVLGGAGGPAIITAVLQTVVEMVDFEMGLVEALALPRFHHQYLPDILMMEKGTSWFRRIGQQWMGQKVVVRDRLGVVNAVAWDEERQIYQGAPDPRISGMAMAY